MRLVFLELTYRAPLWCGARARFRLGSDFSSPILVLPATVSDPAPAPPDLAQAVSRGLEYTSSIAEGADFSLRLSLAAWSVASRLRSVASLLHGAEFPVL